MTKKSIQEETREVEKVRMERIMGYRLVAGFACFRLKRIIVCKVEFELPKNFT